MLASDVTYVVAPAASYAVDVVLMHAHRFVMITGPGPGAGKSTLATNVVRELRTRGSSVRLLPEAGFWSDSDGAELTALLERFRAEDFPGPET